MTYDDARPWAKAIRDEVLARRMPPWGAVKGVGEFRDDPSLSQIEIDMIVNWVEGGAPKGDDIYPAAGAAFRRGNQAAAVAHELKVASAAPHTLSAPADLAGLRPVTAGGGRVSRSHRLFAGRPRGTAHLDPRLAAAMGAHLLFPASYAVPEGHAYRGLFGQAGGSGHHRESVSPGRPVADACGSVLVG